ncbi:hypothetical protein AVT62_gp30 [Streptomyces phage TP1604]|uniref:Uncharacterized protein n=3 Tax=Woodruffvirus TP1604 TaxID=1982746 RepID=A0A0E3M1K8_9CAUD|nr:hypothetical protein AVT62_gp30 [Streptomyces phage TP1604]AKA61768.1 hypothetical protein SEA_TP1604_30 [Streptomyces phage TP1604]AWN08390.1 hypothetical protein SEA_BAYC_30 [Streptomyces phage BayC]AWN08502.1 hypothetical protein SEA_SALETE_30 [Streptomyces phage Salete]USH45405.1 hypothetical protein SEA_ASIS_30 [Streptomyces phage Asis]
MPDDLDPTACVDAEGFEWPEHDYGHTECSRCGAEAP